MTKYEELRITNDFIFCKVMSLKKRLCKHLLELILNIKIRDISFVEPQKTIETAIDMHGVRLDVYVEDDANTIYDVEMQTTKEAGLAKRSRYNQSMIDMHLLERSESYKKLRKSIVIFICTFDLFGSGLPIYRFTNKCDGHTEIELEDETTKIFVNTKAWESAERKELRSLLKYFNSGIITDEYTKDIERTVVKVKQNDRWRVEYMTFGMKLREEREEGFEEGLEQGIEKGIEKGIEQGKLELIYSLLKDEIITISEAAKRAGLTEEELKSRIKK